MQASSGEANQCSSKMACKEGPRRVIKCGVTSPYYHISLTSRDEGGRLADATITTTLLSGQFGPMNGHA